MILKKRMSKKERRRLRRQLKSFLKEFKVESEQSIILKAKASTKISTTVLVNKVFEFCQLYSGIIFYPYQEQFSKRVIRSVLENDGSEITALFSRQSGKQTY